MARLRQYEIEILMDRFADLVNKHNENIRTPNELEAELEIRLHTILPELEMLEELNAQHKLLREAIEEREKNIHREAKKLDLIDMHTRYYSLPTYRNNLREVLSKELGFKEVNHPELRYQILNSDNNNLESIMNTMKEKFNL